MKVMDVNFAKNYRIGIMYFLNTNNKSRVDYVPFQIVFGRYGTKFFQLNYCGKINFESF